MKTIHTLAACAILSAASSPAAADQVHFTGRTTADASLARDTLQTLKQFAYAKRGCSTLASVDAAVLPASYAPADPKYRVANGKKVTYETWSAVLCGETVKFLITFWPSPEGGTMFSVGYPYPSDAP